MEIRWRYSGESGDWGLEIGGCENDAGE